MAWGLGLRVWCSSYLVFRVEGLNRFSGLYCRVLKGGGFKGAR